MDRFKTAFVVGLLFWAGLTFGEEPAAPAAEPPADSWKEGIVQEFPTQYENYIPGFQKQSSQSLEIEGPDQIATEEGGADAPAVTGESDSNFSISEWFEDRNVVNGLLLVGILLLFVIYQMRSGSRRRG